MNTIKTVTVMGLYLMASGGAVANAALPTEDPPAGSLHPLLAELQPPYVHDVPIYVTDTPQEILEKAAHVVPSPAQLLYHRDEFTGFIHFGPNTFTGVEWGNGKEDPNVFNPGETLDTDQWCRAMKAAQMKKVAGRRIRHL